jgi:integrase
VNFTVSNCLAAYWQGHGRHTTGASYIEGTINRINRHPLGGIIAERLHPDDIVAYTAVRRKRGVKDPTIARELVVVRAALNYCRKVELIRKMTHIPVPAGASGKPRERVLSKDESDRLIEACKAPHLRLFTILALNTAARKTAILRLTWDRVDFEHGTINFWDPTLIGRRKHCAVVPMTPQLRAVLADERERVDREFGDAKPTNVVHYHGAAVERVDIAFRRAVGRAGLSGVTPHVLRHTVATRLAMAGISMLEVARYLGHKNSKLTEETYCKFAPGFLKNAAGVLSRF